MSAAIARLSRLLQHIYRIIQFKEKFEQLLRRFITYGCTGGWQAHTNTGEHAIHNSQYQVGIRFSHIAIAACLYQSGHYFHQLNYITTGGCQVIDALDAYFNGLMQFCRNGILRAGCLLCLKRLLWWLYLLQISQQLQLPYFPSYLSQ